VIAYAIQRVERQGVCNTPLQAKPFNKLTNQQKITIMKKLYFFFLLLPLWGLVGIAHASVSVQVLGTDFTNKTVTVRVEYANAVNDRAWVWIYLCSMQGMFQPAEISAASATSGSVLYTTTNTRGFFVTSSPATITATLDNASGQFSCCAYGSDTPPNATVNNSTYTFKGTPPFVLTDADGTTTQTVTGNTLPTSALTITPVTITDETGYSDFFNFCNYAGSDLYVDASHLCQQRTSGAQNWEAYITDRRDNQIYRIVQMPTNTWWMADDLLWDGKPSPDATGYTVRGKDRPCDAHYGCGRVYHANSSGAGDFAGGAADRRQSTACPAGWIIPSQNEVKLYLSGNGNCLAYLSELELGGLNTYGLSLYLCGGDFNVCGTKEASLYNGSSMCYMTVINGVCIGGASNCLVEPADDGSTVRCVRDL
jgi:hypothetical protein